jgi:Protein of unknown function (DUF2971)
MAKENSLKQRIHSGEIPRYIYHYTSLLKKSNNLEPEQSHIWENLKQNSLYFSKPKDFNDPFDSVAHFSKTSIVNLLSGINAEKILDKNVNPKILSLEFCNILKTIQGVCCFSATNNNHLLWSHYSSSHTGICLKFDVLKSIDLFETDLRYVNYRSIMPSINVKKSDDNFGLEEMIFTKSLNWSYEQEIRLLKNTTGPLKFKKTALIEIIFGCNCENHYCNKLIHTLSHNGYKNTKYTLAKQSPINYSLEFIQLKQKEIEIRINEYLKEVIDIIL